MLHEHPYIYLMEHSITLYELHILYPVNCIIFLVVHWNLIHNSRGNLIKMIKEILLKGAIYSNIFTRMVNFFKLQIKTTLSYYITLPLILFFYCPGPSFFSKSHFWRTYSVQFFCAPFCTNFSLMSSCTLSFYQTYKNLLQNMYKFKLTSHIAILAFS